MSEYIRATRKCSVSELHPELLQTIQHYFQEHRLGHLQAETLLCCEIISRRKSSGRLISWLNGTLDDTIYTGLLLTSEWLIWVHYGNQSGIRLNAANLTRIGVDVHTSLFTKDVGLEIVGYVGESNTRVRGQIGMGPEPAAQKFCEEVKQAIAKANPPTTKDVFKWPMG